MLQHEFEERVNLNMTADYYNYVIDPLYMSSKKDKEEFCKEWKELHDISQKKMDFIMEAWQLDCMPLLEAEWNRKKEERKKMKEETERVYTIIFRGACETENQELRDAYIKKYGEKEYLRRKLMEERVITDDDKDMLIKALSA